MIKWIIIAILLFIGIRRRIPTKGIHHIDVPEAKAVRGKGNIQWIDVRSPLEYAGQRDELFRSIPVSKLRKESPNRDKEAPGVVIWQSGVRSNRAANILKRQGFTDIYSVRGGMTVWG